MQPIRIFFKNLAYLQMNQRRRKQPNNKFLEHPWLSCLIIQRCLQHIPTLFPALPALNAKSYSLFYFQLYWGVLWQIQLYICKVYIIMIWYTYTLWSDYWKVTPTNDFLPTKFSSVFNLSSIKNSTYLFLFKHIFNSRNVKLYGKNDKKKMPLVGYSSISMVEKIQTSESEDWFKVKVNHSLFVWTQLSETQFHHQRILTSQSSQTHSRFQFLFNELMIK